MWLKLKTIAIPLPLQSHKTTISTIDESKLGDNEQDTKSHSYKVLLTRPILMPLLIGLTLLTIQQVSGIDSIIFFTVEIFRASGN